MATMYDPPHLGELIRESIEAEGWTVNETAERLNVSKPGGAGASAERSRQRVGGAGAGTDWLERCRTLDADASTMPTDRICRVKEHEREFGVFQQVQRR